MSIKNLDKLNAAGYFRSVVEMSPNALMVISPSGDIAFINNSGAELFGYTVEELDDKPLDVLIPAEFRQRHTSHIARYLAKPDVDPSRSTRTFSGLHKNGSYLTLNIWLHPISVDGQLYTFTSIVNNEAERKLADAKHQLWQAQKMEAIGQLAAGIAHDFNNILTIVLSYSSMIKTLPENTAQSVVTEYAQEIESAARRAAKIVSQLLIFGRNDAIQTSLVQCNDVLTSLVAILDRLLGIDIKAVMQLDPSLKLILADHGQIEQIIVNLAMNARDAMKNGEITIKTENITVTDEGLLMKPGDYVAVSVSDQGHGIPEEIQSKIFDPFFTTKEVGKGTGLGLSTVYGIVKNFGGHIQLTTKIDVGSTFTVYFPVCDVSFVS